MTLSYYLSMVTETRKQREIRERESLILDVARTQLVRGGYLGLNMDRIATEMRYSKGTIYQHFRNKEDILLALANQALGKRTEMFDKAAQHPGEPRQRISAVGAAAEAFVEQFKHYFVVEQVIRASSIWEKTSPERRNYMQSCERRCMSIVGGVVRDGVSSGDLALTNGMQPEDVVFGLWSINWGAQSIFTSSDSLSDIGIQDPVATLRRSQNLLLDGYGWRRLSTEYDYLAHMDEIKAILFNKAQ